MSDKPQTPATYVAFKPVSVGKRMCVSFGATIFGLLFFYVVMVIMSTLADNITLEKLERNGWPRAASRHTAFASSVTFILFQLVPPSSVWSLVFAVFSACAQFCHFVILSSDLSVYADPVIAKVVFRLEPSHPIFKRLPIYTAHVLGTIGFLSHLVITTERCFGLALHARVRSLPLVSLVAASWIFSVYMLWFVDHLVYVLFFDQPLKSILFPLYFIIPHLTAQYVMIRRFRALSKPSGAALSEAADKKAT